MRRFKQCRDAMKNYAGKSIVNDFVEHTEGYKKATTQAKRQQLKDEAFDQYMAYLLLKQGQ